MNRRLRHEQSPQVQLAHTLAPGEDLGLFEHQRRKPHLSPNPGASVRTTKLIMTEQIADYQVNNNKYLN